MSNDSRLAPKLTGLFDGTPEEYQKYLEELRAQPKSDSFDAKMQRIFSASAPLASQRPQPKPTSAPQVPTPAPDYEPSENNVFGDRAWDVYSDSVAQIESGGKYDIQGGYNSHYDGKYQMGRVAKQDAARRLGTTLGHSADERSAYLADPELQERAFEAFTLTNHDTLSRRSEKYRGMSQQEQLSILAYAHNQGAGGALAYLRTGKAGKDGFGTSGQKYVDAVRGKFGGAS